MKKRIIYLTLPVLFLALVSSCYEDKGNYDYVDIAFTDITLSETDPSGGNFSLDRYNNLVVQPQLTFTGGAKESDFSYEWSIYLQSAARDDENNYYPKKVIGDAPSLSYYVVDSPDQYYLSLRATHKETGATSFFTANLTVNSVWGWLVMDEDNAGKGDLHIIRDGEIIPGFQEEDIVRNFFSMSNDGLKIEEGAFLARLQMYTLYDNLYVFRNNGVYKLNSKTYELITDDYSQLFLTQPAVHAPMAHDYPNPNYGAFEVFINNNEVYTVNWRTMGQTDHFSTTLAIFGVPIKVAPFIAPIPVISGNTNRAVCYSTTVRPLGTFITINTSGGMGYPATVDGPFNPIAINSGGTNLQLTYMANGKEGITCALFHDENDNRRPWLLQGDFRVAATPIALAKIDLSALPGIALSEHYAFGTRGDVMFYSTGSKVYSYLIGGNATELLSAPGEEVVGMKVYTHSDNIDYDGRILFVATWNGSEGKVHKIHFNELTGRATAPVETFGGFGRIIDMMNKE